MRHGYPTETHRHRSGAEPPFAYVYTCHGHRCRYLHAGFYLHIGLTAERGDEIERRLGLPLIACLAPPSGAIVSTWQPEFGMDAMRASERPWPAREDELTALRRSSLHAMHPCSRPDIQSAVLETARATCDIPRRDVRTGMPDEGSLVACVAAVSHGKGEGLCDRREFPGPGQIQTSPEARVGVPIPHVKPLQSDQSTWAGLDDNSHLAWRGAGDEE